MCLPPSESVYIWLMLFLMTTSPFILLLSNSFMVFLHLLIFLLFPQTLCLWCGRFISSFVSFLPLACPHHNLTSSHSLNPKVLLLKVLSSKVDLAKSGASVTVAPWEPVAAHRRVHKEWQRPLSGVHSIHHDGKISPGWWGWGGGASSPPFTIFTITYKVVVYGPAERAGTFPLFLLYPSTLWNTPRFKHT
jgi:hypothetical protein